MASLEAARRKYFFLRLDSPAREALDELLKTGSGADGVYRSARFTAIRGSRLATVIAFFGLLALISLRFRRECAEGCVSPAAKAEFDALHEHPAR